MAKAKPKMKCKVVTITPKMASKLLDSNPNNRNINQARVSEYSQTIGTGHWLETGESIIINWDGDLMDGQHRLLGCEDSGKPIVSVVVTDVDPAAYVAIDQGQIRSAAQILRQRGEIYTNDLSASTTFLVHYEEKSTTFDKRLPMWRRLDIIERNPDLRSTIKFVKSCHFLTKTSGSTAVSCGVHYIASQKHGEKADEFYRKLNAGTELTEDDPIYVLREWLSWVKNQVGVRYRWPDVFSAYKGAWNGFIEERSMVSIERETSGKRLANWELR